MMTLVGKQTVEPEEHAGWIALELDYRSSNPFLRVETR